MYREAFRLSMQHFQGVQEVGLAKSASPLTDQIRRSSRSVCANLAEGWRKRPYPKHFASKLNDAESEAEETRTWLDLRYCLRLRGPQRFTKSLTTAYDKVIGSLVSMQTQR